MFLNNVWENLVAFFKSAQKAAPIQVQQELGMGVIVNGKQELIPNVETHSWIDVPALRLKIGEDGRRRKKPIVRCIVLHTTKGIPGGKDRRPQDIRPGKGPDIKADEKVARYWSNSDRAAGAHITVDFDGSVGCHADLLTEVTYHAGRMNEGSIGIEIFQGRNAEMYEEQLEKVVLLVDWLTARFGIQRQVHAGYEGKPIPRFSRGSSNVVGVIGHRSISANRGEGDPGLAPFQYLIDSGYEDFDYSKTEDLEVWKARQKELGLKPDGVPGAKTVQALKDAGYPDGIWVKR